MTCTSIAHGFVSGPGFSQAEKLTFYPGFSPCKNDPRTKAPLIENCFAARLNRLRKNSRGRDERVERTFRFAPKFFVLDIRSRLQPATDRSFRLFPQPVKTCPDINRATLSHLVRKAVEILTDTIAAMQFHWSEWFSASTHRKRWEKTRAKGKKHFVLWRGIVGFGGGMFVVITVSHTLLWPTPYHSVIREMVINLIVWPVSGFFWGLWMWSHLNEKFETSSKLTTGN